MELLEIPIEQIDFGDRFREDLGDINMLVDSIKREGIIQPLAVKRTGDRFMLLAGGRRYTAAKQANCGIVPVRVYPEALTPIEMREIELMENVCRKDLTWYESARLKNEIHELKVQVYGEKISTIPDAAGWSMQQTADLLGVTRGLVSQEISLVKAVDLFPQLQQAKTKLEATKQLAQIREDMVREELSKRVAAKSDGLQAKLHEAYHVCDFFDWVKTVPDNSIDIVEVDPPYGIDLQSAKKLNYSDSKLDVYNEVDGATYPAFIGKVAYECYRIMKPDSWLIMWFAIHPWIYQIHSVLTQVGFQTRLLPAMWYKQDSNLQTMQPGLHLASAYEPFFYARKGQPSIVRQGRSNVFTYKPVYSQSKIHPTERPVELMQDILSTFGWEGSRVVVPFAGSGNTLLAAANLGMTAEGCDLTQQYKDGYIIRVAETIPPKYRSYKEAT